ncbi:hypothetical protein [Cytobacillus horneckiae]|uniref:hypothetical protein n=1 Tax=Cytobacillus horneckiae TaxID=549687 RepID=UPI000A8D0C7D|nr:hypothetical protein [Cytobacillus horneckiae]
MYKKWAELSDLDCVKELGIRHRIGHFLGVQMISRCYLALSRITTREFLKTSGRD